MKPKLSLYFLLLTAVGLSFNACKEKVNLSDVDTDNIVLEAGVAAPVAYTTVYATKLYEIKDNDYYLYNQEDGTVVFARRARKRVPMHAFDIAGVTLSLVDSINMSDFFDTNIIKDSHFPIINPFFQVFFRTNQHAEIDAVFSGMFDTEERRKLAAFTETYESAKSEYGIIVNKHSKYSGARTLEDFSGAKLLAQRSTKLDSAIDQVPGAVHMPPVDTVSETLQRVVNGEVDGLVINVDTGRSYERTYSNLKLITFPQGKGFTLDFHGVCAGVRKRDKELLNEINDAIRSISLRERKRIMDASISRVRNF